MVEDSHLKKKMVLIIEDDIFLRKALQVKFKKEGLEIWVASDGKEALSYLEREAPDVVLLDLMIPSVSGFDVLAAIRKNERWKNVPVIILTVLAQPQDIKRGKELGATDYLVKTDVKIGEVVEKVKKFL